MSTRIDNATEFPSPHAYIGNLDGYPSAPRMAIRIGETHDDQTIANVSRADFLAAVEAECGVIVIDRAELPEVKVDDSGHICSGRTQWPSLAMAYKHRAALRGDALENFALAEYLDAHPPVDAEAVAALAAALKDDPQFGLGRPDADEIARRLVIAGWKR